mmetsp:Transcript_15226/g.35281  ORF Transcript_15226/g.35281 Transcript_15226/m.35281 type:complete len:302 (-) Transcript_15226:31-936(-)
MAGRNHGKPEGAGRIDRSNVRTGAARPVASLSLTSNPARSRRPRRSMDEPGTSPPSDAPPPPGDDAAAEASSFHRSSSPSRYFPVRTRIAVPIPASSAPRQSAETSSPIMQTSSARIVFPADPTPTPAFMLRTAWSKIAPLGFPITVAGAHSDAASSARRKAPGPRLRFPDGGPAMDGDQVAGVVQEHAEGPVHVLVAEPRGSQSHHHRIVATTAFLVCGGGGGRRCCCGPRGTFAVPARCPVGGNSNSNNTSGVADGSVDAEVRGIFQQQQRAEVSLLHVIDRRFQARDELLGGDAESEL